MYVYIQASCLQTGIYEYSYFDCIVSHVRIEKEKTSSKKEDMKSKAFKEGTVSEPTITLMLIA